MGVIGNGVGSIDHLDLEGQDISNYTDPNGKRLFVEFVRVVKAHGAGYVDYEWQWKDDPNRIVPKISYVKGFEPWGWIVGTGAYVSDIDAELSAMRWTAIVSLVVSLVEVSRAQTSYCFLGAFVVS